MIGGADLELCEAGCDSIRGYLSSPPLDVNGIAAWLGMLPTAPSERRNADHHTEAAPVQKEASLR